MGLTFVALRTSFLLLGPHTSNTIDASMALEPGTRLGPYRLEGVLGAGGMGEVYRARDVRLDRTVAIKILSALGASDQESRHRFEREAKAIAALSHPHICAPYDVGEEASPDGSGPGRVQFLVMTALPLRPSTTPITVLLNWAAAR